MANYDEGVKMNTRHAGCVFMLFLLFPCFDGIILVKHLNEQIFRTDLHVSG